MFREDPWQHRVLLEGGKGNLGPRPPAELGRGFCAPGRSSQEHEAGAALRKLPSLSAQNRWPRSFQGAEGVQTLWFSCGGGGLLLRKQLAFVYKNV